MRHGSLFSGIGGFDLAAEWMGWENAFHCEWEDFPRKVLAHHFPNAKSYGDIKETDFTIWRGRIDILSGGFPCQPFSQAGKRQGTEDDRYLWHEMLRAIQEISPRWVVGENVRGLVNWNGGMVFDQVCSDLESEGYKVFPVLIPAAAVNAPHRRDRIWFVAYSDKVRLQQRENSREVGRGQGEVGREGSEFAEPIKADGKERATPDSYGAKPSDRSRENREEEREVWRYEEGYVSRELPSYGATTDSESAGGEGERIERPWEVQPNGRGEQNAQRTWEEFPTQPPVCGGDDGIPRELDFITFPKWRNESIKAYGNAIVPQVAYELFKIIHEISIRS